jgi:two-component system sensor histidine kinase CreC
MGLVDLLKEMPPGAKRSHVAHTMRSALSLASTKLAGLATVWHAQSGSVVHARLIEFDVREVVQQTFSLFACQAEDEGAKLALQCNQRRAMACGDPETLQLVLMELIDNSLRWFPSAVKERRVLVEVIPGSKPGAWHLFVSDNGSGFDKHTRERAFEVKPSTGRSTGLGLPGVRLLVVSLGGTIEVLPKARLGSGATIAIYLRSGE